MLAGVHMLPQPGPSEAAGVEAAATIAATAPPTLPTPGKIVHLAAGTQLEVEIVAPLSSAANHLGDRFALRLTDRDPQFSTLIAGDGDDGFAALRRSEGSGRRVGTADFIADLERRLSRPIARRAPGRKSKPDDGEHAPLLL
jgi:hypothetical protein